MPTGVDSLLMNMAQKVRCPAVCGWAPGVRRGIADSNSQVEYIEAMRPALSTSVGHRAVKDFHVAPRDTYTCGYHPAA